MSAALLGLASALVSAVGLALLAATDPKRRRGREGARPRAWRLPAAALAVGPGLWLALTGRGVSFLLWIGAAAVLGWAVAALANLAPRQVGLNADSRVRIRMRRTMR